MEFALKLYQELGVKSSGNIFFSPFSVSSVLSMLAVGADGETLSQLLQTLGATSETDFHERNQKHMIELINATQTDGPILLNVGNKIYTDLSFDLKQEFVDLCLKYYSGVAEGIDFRGEPEKSRLAINAWIEEATRSKIKNLIPSGSIRPDTSLVLANAIYFKGKWNEPFDPRQTHKGKFHAAEGKTVDVDMMTLETKFAISYDDKLRLQVLEVPYKGNEIALVLLVPTQTFGLAEIEKQLTPGHLTNYSDEASIEKVRLSLPKMKLEQQIMDLDVQLRQIGVKNVFDMSSANLSKMSLSNGLYVSKMAHKAVFEVTEEGSEAAAATMGIAVMSMPITVTCDHPFMFLLKHKPTDVVLFVGRFVTP